MVHVPRYRRDRPEDQDGPAADRRAGRKRPSGDARRACRKLVGKTFAAQIGTSMDGQYSRVVHDTIAPAPPEAAEGDHSDGDGQEKDFERIPF